MRHLSQQDLDPKLRRPHLAKWKRELAVILQNPGLPAPQRSLIQERLARLGQPKVYRASDPAPPGALDPGPIRKTAPIPAPTISPRDDLSQLPKSRLVAYAKANRINLLPHSTKAQVIEAIRAQETK